MRFQLYFPFVDEFPTEYKAEGVVSVSSYLQDAIGKEKYQRECKKNSQRVVKEYGRIARILGKEKSPDEENQEYTLFLLGETIRDFYFENFLPRNFIRLGERIENIGRDIYKAPFLRRDGKKEIIVAKRQKLSFSHLNNPPEDWITSVSEIRVFKDVSEEVENLLELNSLGVPVENPVGYFKEGIEQYIFTRFVHGENPKEIITDDSRRNSYWKEDAKLLARLANAGYKHQGFYSPEFDDKIWDGKNVILIDADETFKVAQNWRFSDYFRENPDKLSNYFISSLEDCLSYVFSKVMRKDEMIPYAQSFLEERGEDVSRAEKIVENLEIGRCTEESYFAMMMDCD